MKFLIAFDFIIPDAWLPLPDSVGLQTDRPFFVPDDEGAFSTFPSIAVRIDRLGKCIETRFAYRYWREVAPALLSMPNVAVRNLEHGIIPNASLLCFDSAIITGHWIQTDAPEFTFSPSDNTIAIDRTLIDDAIRRFSLLNTLKTGDILIFPAKSPFAPVPDTVVTAYSAQNKEQLLLRTKIK